MQGTKSMCMHVHNNGFMAWDCKLARSCRGGRTAVGGAQPGLPDQDPNRCCNRQNSPPIRFSNHRYPLPQPLWKSFSCLSAQDHDCTPHRGLTQRPEGQRMGLSAGADAWHFTGSMAHGPRRGATSGRATSSEESSCQALHQPRLQCAGECGAGPRGTPSGSCGRTCPAGRGWCPLLAPPSLAPHGRSAPRWRCCARRARREAPARGAMRRAGVRRASQGQGSNSTGPHCPDERGPRVACTGGGGGDWCQVKLAVVNLAVVNLAEAPGFRVVNLADTPRK